MLALPSWFLSRLQPVETHLVNVRVYQRNVVVAGDAVAQRVEPLVYALHHQLVWQAIPDVHHLCRRKPRSVNTFTGNALGHVKDG